MEWLLNIFMWTRSPNFTVKGRFYRDDEDTLWPDPKGEIIQYTFNNETYIHTGEWPIPPVRQLTFSVPIREAIFVDEDEADVYPVTRVLKQYMGPRHKLENLPVGFRFGLFHPMPYISAEWIDWSVRVSVGIKYICVRQMHGKLYATDSLGKKHTCTI